MSHEKILVLDLGSQYTQLIARRVREQGVYSEIVSHDIPAATVREQAPRGLILSTGEQHPSGQSLLARVMLLQVEKGQVDLARLSAAQTSAAQLPHAMTGYLTWLAPQMATLPEKLKATFVGSRARLTTGTAHLRIPEGLCHLWLGLHCGLEYAVDIGACTPTEGQALEAECWDAILAIGRLQEHLVVGGQPVRRFLNTLLTLLTQQQALLLPKYGYETDANADDHLIGWQDDEWIYLLPEGAHRAVSRFCRETGELFSLTRDRLRRELIQDGLAVGDDDHQTTTARLGGRTRRVMKLDRAAVERYLGETFPSGSRSVTGITGE